MSSVFKYRLNYYKGFLLLAICYWIVSCNKTVPVSPLDFQKQLLAGTGTFQNTEKKWKLDSAYLNGALINLTTTQRAYFKIFTYDGNYADFERNEGVWEISTLNKLKQTIIYKAIDSVTKKNKIDSTTYDIININAYQMKLKTTNLEYVFKISN